MADKIVVPGETVIVRATLPPNPEPTTPTLTSPTIIESPQVPTNSFAFVSNPASRGINDLTDIRPSANPTMLPVRGEKRIIPSATNLGAISDQFNADLEGNGIDPEFQNNSVSDSDFYIRAAKRTYKDFIKVVIPHRGVNPSTLQADPSQDATFTFLVNPATMSVNRQTVDAQAFTRGGWQFGVWGEDIFQVQMSGQSAGSYFTKGLTDAYDFYSVSYRNLMQLQQVFENNGYWFEGEESNEGPLAADYTRRRIRMHQDVELWVGNFIWYGMFESLVLSQDAENPFTIDFNLTFIVWKERFRSTSPYFNNIENNVQRGHSYAAVEAIKNGGRIQTTVSQVTPMSNDARNAQMNQSLTNNPNADAPAVKASSSEDLLQTVDTQALDNYGPTDYLLNPDGHTDYWLY